MLLYMRNILLLIKGAPTPEVHTSGKTLILLFSSLFYGAEPKEHHRKTRLAKNEKLTISLAEDMARSATDISE